MTQHLFPFAREMFIVDLFCGGGGASEGIKRALGREPDIAVNHDADAIRMHEANHPDAMHLQCDVFEVDPVQACGGRRPDLLWASPNCTHFSRAKGGKPLDAKIRSLADVVVVWARKVRPQTICMENVSEFADWGPLGTDGRPIKARKGEMFREFVASLEGEGYAVEWRVICCADYGDPTSRRRLFLVATLDGAPVWPEATHGPGTGQPHRTAAECIDWSIPVPSMFERKRPYAEKTQARIAAGIKRYVLDSEDPYIVHGGARSLIQTGYGERKGQAPRVLDLEAPLGTVVAGGQKHALVTAWIAKHYGGVVGIPCTRPLSTVTSTDHHSVVAAHLTKFYGTSTGQDVREPVPTVTAKGNHAGLVYAFLTKYYGRAVGQALSGPLHAVTGRDRFGLVTVTVQGEPYVIVDIGMRMLQPRELARAHSFGDDYVLTGTKTSQVHKLGNSVPVETVRAIVEANVRRGMAAREAA